MHIIIYGLSKRQNLTERAILIIVNIVKVFKMIKRKVVEKLVSIVKFETKTNINSTGSAWSYQPKIPEKAMNYKKK